MSKTTLEPPISTPLLVAGRYDVMLDELLGEGGISQVFKGYDRDGKQPVAAKRLQPKYSDDTAARRRFEREQRICSIFEHPNVVGYIDKTNDWLILEYVDGAHLKDSLEVHAPYAVSDAVRIVSGVVSGLAHLHASDVVHLDIKPQNIMVNSRNQVKVIDLGLAHEFADRQMDSFGTIAYMSPEQIDRGPVDARTDIYALGCVMYELLTGRPPFVAEGLSDDARNAYLVDAHRYDEVLPPSTLREDLPPWADDVIDRALAKNPDNRYQSATAMFQAIDRGMKGGRTFRSEDTSADDPTKERPHPERGQRFGPPQPVEPAGPSIVERFLRWCLASLLAIGRRVARIPLHVSRKLAIPLIAVALVLLLNVPLVSNAMMEVAIDVVPWTDTQVGSEPLRLRSEPSTTSETLAILEPATSVSVAGLPEEHNGDTWWPVMVDGETGWVSGQYLRESSLMNVVTKPGELRESFTSLFGFFS